MPIILTVICLTLPAAEISGLVVTSNIFNSWDLASGLQMRRSVSNPAVWRVSLNIHLSPECRETGTSFQYNYVLKDNRSEKH